jgi:chromate transporter
MAEPSVPPPFRAALRFWAKLGWIAFGGPTGQIAILHEELVVRRGWIAEADFLQGLNFCLMLPGPEAQQFATYLGWRLHGVRGALAAGILFFLPAMLILWGLSLVYVLFGAVPTIAAAFYGLVPAVLAIIFRALLLLAKRTLKTPIDGAIAAVAAVLMIVLHGNYPLIVLGAALVGAWFHRNRAAPETPVETSSPIRLPVLARTAFWCVAAWWAPLLLAWLVLGRKSIIVAEGLFFSKAALVTFGGAYVVLPYVAHHAVALHHWLSADDMLHGVALAGTIPGPLVIVVQFIAFVGAWHQPGTMAPLLAATLAALLASWMTFAPSFLYILVGGPFLQRLLRLEFLQGALRAISAAVIGVMIDFAIWFGGEALFPAHQWMRPDWFVLIVGLGALATLIRFRASVPALLGACAVLGVVYRIIPW